MPKINVIFLIRPHSTCVQLTLPQNTSFFKVHVSSNITSSVLGAYLILRFYVISPIGHRSFRVLNAGRQK